MVPANYSPYGGTGVYLTFNCTRQIPDSDYVEVEWDFDGDEQIYLTVGATTIAARPLDQITIPSDDTGTYRIAIRCTGDCDNNVLATVRVSDDGQVTTFGSVRAAQETYELGKYTFKGNRAPEGFFDGFSPDGAVFQGWARDPDAPNVPLQVHVYADAPAGQGGVGVTVLAADVNRADVGAHGFSGPNPVGEGRNLYAYAIGVNRDGVPDGRNTLLGGSPRSTPTKLPEGAVGSVDGNFVSGWARDTSRPDVPIDVHVYVGGQFYAAAVANQSTGATWKPPGWAGVMASWCRC